MAEGVGFEPTSPFGEAVFKTAALNHSAIPPLIHAVRQAISVFYQLCIIHDALNHVRFRAAMHLIWCMARE